MISGLFQAVKNVIFHCDSQTCLMNVLCQNNNVVRTKKNTRKKKDYECHKKWTT